ncbi:MAG: acyltransferase family protein [Candidatus Aquicultor sp.]
METNRRKIQWLDNLKIIALLCIMTFHFWPALNPHVRDFGISFGHWPLLTLPLRNGFQGTFLFIITSGTGLTLLVSNKKITWAEFYRSRVLRVYVPYWVTLFIALVIYSFGINVSLTPPKSALGWISNILLVDVPFEQRLQPHLWFLFALIQLYLVFPFIYKFTKRTGQYGLAGMFVLQFLAFYSSSLYPSALFKIVLSHFLVWVFPFQLGVFVGVMLSSHRERTERIMHKLFPVGLIIWAIGTIANNYPQGNPITFAFISVGLLLIAFKAASLNWRLPIVNSASYETYLIHITILAILSPVLKPLSVSLFFVVFLVGSLLAGYVVKQICAAIYDAIQLGLRPEPVLPSPEPTVDS